ncbi:hypothetical protein JG688_00015966 [Phytophthora aleatoria]|uniref:Uncharacterized protein n=1 Tax=Phytophthora aleatoria TaxID=2496075 RepID=A0A8J5I973_9STRA|nr:hypothetical protein JG688_00015966 [Phytophthora aleatoria]
MVDLVNLEDLVDPGVRPYLKERRSPILVAILVVASLLEVTVTRTSPYKLPSVCCRTSRTLFV